MTKTALPRVGLEDMEDAVQRVFDSLRLYQPKHFAAMCRPKASSIEHFAVALLEVASPNLAFDQLDSRVACVRD